MRLKTLLPLVLVSALLTAGWGCAAIFAPPLQTVGQVDIERYTGKWYEIARYPNFFETNCENVTAEYTLQEDGTVSVLNICRSGAGEETERIEGTARVPDPDETAKLVVSFPSAPFPAPYWIIDLAPDYSYAVVGDPTRNFLWILSRTPTLDSALYESILGRIAELGYDTGRVVSVDQSANQIAAGS